MGLREIVLWVLWPHWWIHSVIGLKSDGILESDGHLQGGIYFRRWLLGSIPFGVQLALSFCSMITMNWAVFFCHPPHHVCHITATEAGGLHDHRWKPLKWKMLFFFKWIVFSVLFFFFLTVTEAARHREDRGEGALNLTEENLNPVWEDEPGQAEKSKELSLVTLQLGVAAPALLDLDWSHCRAEGVQTCQPHSRDRRYNRLDRERKHFLHSSEWMPPNHLFFWFLKLGSFLLIPSLPRFV